MRLAKYVLLLTLTSCASEPSVPTAQHAPTTAFSCGRIDASCAIANGALLALTVAFTPINGSEAKAPRDTLHGRCVLHVEGLPERPCDNVALELSSADVKNRSAWVQGYEFEVPSVGRAPLEVRAKSELHQASASAHHVMPGSFLKIEIKVPARKVSR